MFVLNPIIQDWVLGDTLPRTFPDDDSKVREVRLVGFQACDKVRMVYP